MWIHVEVWLALNPINLKVRELVHGLVRLYGGSGVSQKLLGPHCGSHVVLWLYPTGSHFLGCG